MTSIASQQPATAVTRPIVMTKADPAIPKVLKFAFGEWLECLHVCSRNRWISFKNRMQMSGELGKAKDHKSSLHAIRTIIRTEGVAGFYNGLSAGLFRQATYTTCRLGLYTVMFERFSGTSGQAPSFAMKAGLGLAAGGASSFVCTPAEVGLIRMTTDGRLPAAQRRGYSSIFNALYTISRSEGVLTLWRGCGPTVGRAMVVNAAQLATYSQAKGLLLDTGHFHDNILCHFSASMISGFVTSVVSMPVDIAKTRIQNMHAGEYAGTVDVWRQVVRREGVLALWKGLTPYFARLGPHTVLTFMFLEQLNSAYYKHWLGVDKARGGL